METYLLSNFPKAKGGNMLYIYDEIVGQCGELLPRLIPYLSKERLEKVFSYRFKSDSMLSASAYLLLCLALRDNYGISGPVIFSYGKHGKPYLRDYPQIYFNLSHCRCAVACAVSDTEIGVDIQDIVHVDNGVAKRVLTASEYAEFEASDSPYELFCEYWTVKESELKRIGTGIAADLTALSADDVLNKTVFMRDKSYFCCAAGASDIPIRRVKLFEEICDYESIIS